MESPTDKRLITPLYTAEQVRELDRIAIEQEGIPGVQLMKRAGRSAFEAALEAFPEAQKLVVLCGSGNNAGDGYVVAALAASKCMAVELIQVGDESKLGDDAQQALAFAKDQGLELKSWAGDLPEDADLIVDALLGTGFSSLNADKTPTEFLAAMQAANASAAPTLALDLPSGLDANTGSALPDAIRAEQTITFIGIKRGLLTGRGPALCGQLHFDDLQVNTELQADIQTEVCELDLSAAALALSHREADAHKGLFGHVMVIGGDAGMGGAPLMAVEVAARVGAGLVSVATRPEHVAAILARRPEAMVSGVTSGQGLEPLLSRPSVLVVGPGLGRSAWSEQVLQQALKAQLPMILDADGLNILGEGRILPEAHRDNWILTPHPGEAARLLKCSTAEVQGDRFAAVRALQKTYGGVVVLKGAGTLIASEASTIYLSTAGNPGMASGGMGDVLSGILGALLAQGLSLSEAAELGVGLHSAAADRVAGESGQHGMLATDLIPHVHDVINQLLDSRA